MSVVFLPAAHAGWIEDRDDGSTIIHVDVTYLPDPERTSPFDLAEGEGMRTFLRRFPAIFAGKYRDRYRADPETYGDHNWDRVAIELHPATGIRIPEIESDLLAIAGNLAPDVLYVNFRKSDTYIRNGFLYPLDKPEDPYLAAMAEEEINRRVHPGIRPVIRRKGPDGTTHVWAMPYGGALGKVLVYRKALFDEKGLAYPTAEWTWDDLYDACRVLTDPASGITGMGFSAGKHESWNWITFLWSAGGEAMVYEEETDTWRCAFGSDEAAVALDFYLRLCGERWTDADGRIQRGYAVRADAATFSRLWEQGKMAMAMTYVEERLYQTFNPEQVGMAPVPLGPTGMRGAELNSRMLGLFSGIEERAVRDAAWEYIRFYDSEESIEIKTRIQVESGHGQYINPVYLEKYGFQEIIRLSPRGWSETFDIAIRTGKPEPFGRNSSIAYDMMTFPINEAEALLVRDRLPGDRTERLAALRGILDRANARANEEMMGVVAPAERAKRDAGALVVVLGLLAAIALLFRKVGRAFSPPAVGGAVPRAWGFVKYRWSYLLMVPAVLTILVWHYVPLGQGSIMAFQDYRIVGESTWVGLQNFGDLLFDFRPNGWWVSVLRAAQYTLLVIALTFLPPILLAILLHEVPRSSLVFRIVYYLPAMVVGLVTALLWKQFYDPSDAGVLNAILLHIPTVALPAAAAAGLWIAIRFARRMRYHEMGLASWLALAAGVVVFAAGVACVAPILLPAGESWGQRLALCLPRLLRPSPEAFDWLGDSRTAMAACVLPMVWAGIGPGCLIYLAALRGIPDDVYEAADVDGASPIDKVLFVVFPILKPLIVINFIGVFIGSVYGAGGNILALTGGGAGTEVADLHIFYKAFVFLQFGPATAMAWVLGFLLIGFTVYQLQVLSRMEFRAEGSET